MADIFISYSHADLERVRPIAEALQAHGWDLWWDIDSLGAGQSFQQAVESALSQAKCVLALWTKTSVDSRWVGDEAHWAWEHDKLASVILDEGLRLPFPFDAAHSENLSGWSGDTTAPPFKKLIAGITSIVGVPSAELPGEAKPDSDLGSVLREQLDKDSGGARVPRRQWRRRLDTWLKRVAVLVPVGVALYGASLLTQAGLARMVVVEHAPTSEPCSHLPGSGPEMVVVRGGTFEMGDRQGTGGGDERPVHTVAVPTFAIGRCEVTFDEYDAFAEATGRDKPADQGWGRGRRPVINVSWTDAVAFTEWLSAETGERYRLPTEAEWEFATRAGTDTDYWWGNEARLDGKVWANCNGCGSEWDNRQTAPVGSFPANPFGVHDIAGNVWEWVRDCWHENYDGAPKDGSAWLDANGGDCARRMNRGGSWLNRPRDVRTSSRNWNFASVFKNLNLGFRLAQDLQ